MTQPTTAPEGALFAFLGILQAAPIMLDPEHEEWISTNGLIAYDATGTMIVTAKGKAWADLILATPLPVEIRKWSDPRAEAAETISLPASDVRDLLLAALTKPTLPSVSAMRDLERQRTAAGEQTQMLQHAVGEVPPGFNPNRFTALSQGQIPAGMERDSDIEVVFRNGKRLKNPAIAIRWTDTNKPDDVIAYRLLPPEALSDDARGSTGFDG